MRAEIFLQRIQFCLNLILLIKVVLPIIWFDFAYIGTDHFILYCLCISIIFSALSFPHLPVDKQRVSLLSIMVPYISCQSADTALMIPTGCPQRKASALLYEVQSGSEKKQNNKIGLKKTNKKHQGCWCKSSSINLKEQT